MATVHSVNRGRTVKTVTLADVDDTDTDAALVDIALAATGETRSSLFDIRVSRLDYDDLPRAAVIALHTD